MPNTHAPETLAKRIAGFVERRRYFNAMDLFKLGRENHELKPDHLDETTREKLSRFICAQGAVYQIAVLNKDVRPGRVFEAYRVRALEIADQPKDLKRLLDRQVQAVRWLAREA